MTTATTITVNGWTGFLGRELSLLEVQCVLGIAGGQTSKELARDLGVQPDSIKKRVLSATTKLGVTRRAALVAKAFALGLIQTACVIAPNPDPQRHEDSEDHQGIFIA